MEEVLLRNYRLHRAVGPMDTEEEGKSQAPDLDFPNRRPLAQQAPTPSSRLSCPTFGPEAHCPEEGSLELESKCHYAAPIPSSQEALAQA